MGSYLIQSQREEEIYSALFYTMLFMYAYTHGKSQLLFL